MDFLLMNCLQILSCCFCLLLTCIFVACGDSYYPIKPLYFALPRCQKEKGEMDGGNKKYMCADTALTPCPDTGGAIEVRRDTERLHHNDTGTILQCYRRSMMDCAGNSFD